MNLGILNTIIAMVIVLLVLSLLVQSVQMFVKKTLKLKSKQIEDSLKDLYDQAIARLPEQEAAVPANGAGDVASPEAEQFTTRVVNEFKKIGRVTRFGNTVLDSLSKEDLFKVMGRLESEGFVPDYVTKFQLLANQVIGLRNAIEALTANEALSGAASAKIAQLRAILAPIFNDVQAILDDRSQVKEKVVFGDLLRLRQLNIANLLGLLGDAQQAITQEKESALSANAKDTVKQLQSLSDELARVANLIGELSQKFDDAIAPLRKKIEQVEIWFDTVMQSFDERYARSMRTVAIYISIVVVILLNANFFRVYRSLSTNEVQRNLIVENGPEVLKRAAAAQPTPAASPNASPQSSPQASPVNIKEEAERTRQQINVLVSDYEGFGFTPISGPQVWSFVWSTGGWTAVSTDDKGRRGWWGMTVARDDKGNPVNRDNESIAPDCNEIDKDGNRILKDGWPVNCKAAWRVQSPGEWWESRKHDVVVLIGWAIMVLLLSVGAPFWQDTLESLFGVKNLLRQKSGTQNIETKSGAGQPKQA